MVGNDGRYKGGYMDTSHHTQLYDTWYNDILCQNYIELNT